MFFDLKLVDHLVAHLEIQNSRRYVSCILHTSMTTFGFLNFSLIS